MPEALAEVKVVKPVDEPNRRISEFVKVWAAVHVWARLVSAIVPVLAGNVAVKLLAPALALVKVVAPVEEPSNRISELVKVWAAVHVSAKFNSDTVPVLAGREAVTVPRAPVTVWRVTRPEVAFPKATLPGVPEAPRVGVAVKDGVAPARTPPAAGETAPTVVPLDIIN